MLDLPTQHGTACYTVCSHSKTKRRLPPRTLACCWTLDESRLGKIAQASWDRTMPSVLSCRRVGADWPAWSARATNHNVSPMGRPRPFIMELSRSPRHRQGRPEICSCPFPVPPVTDDCVVESAAVHSGRGISSGSGMRCLRLSSKFTRDADPSAGSKDREGRVLKGAKVDV